MNPGVHRVRVEARCWQTARRPLGTPVLRSFALVASATLLGGAYATTACRRISLYRYAGDIAPGQSSGQDVGGIWFVVNP